MKAQRDQRARLQQARAEGEALGKDEGKAEGNEWGPIETLRGLLGEPTMPREGMSIDKVAAIADDLQRRLRERGGWSNPPGRADGLKQVPRLPREEAAGRIE